MRKKWIPNGSKYHSNKVTLDGMTFDSKRECLRFLELSRLERVGAISELQRQVSFELIPAQREPDTIGKRGGLKRGKLIERSVVYIADFTYKDADGNLVVEDTKGVRTKDYIIKRKLMLERFGIRISEV